jgi:hypothetical protein
VSHKAARVVSADYYVRRLEEPVNWRPATLEAHALFSHCQFPRDAGAARRRQARVRTWSSAGLPDTKVGRFSQALYEEAKSKGWIVISIKDDWKRIFAFEQ